MSADRRQARLSRKLKKISAEFRLLASSGKNELLPTPANSYSEENDVEKQRRRVMEMKRKRDEQITPKLYSKTTSDEENTIDLDDVYDLILYAVLGNKVNTPRSFDLLQWRRVSQAILVLVDQDHPPSDLECQHFPFIRGNFLRKVDVKWSRERNEDFYRGLFSIPRPIVDHLREYSSANRTIGSKGLITKLDLLLSPIDMALEGFPLPLYYTDKKTDYEYSRKTYKRPTIDSPVYAIDCEMCLTGRNRYELTRISMVNEQYQVVLDTLVKPELPVIDYLTRFSGITEAMLGPVHTRLSDVQQYLERILEPDAILCGHSLQHDLHSLRLFHPHVIDVSVAFNLKGERRMKSSLKALASTFLEGLEIQQSSDGHCSVEDAYATMRLLHKKLEGARLDGDPAFGNVVDGWDFFQFKSSLEPGRKRDRERSESDEEQDKKRKKPNSILDDDHKASPILETESKEPPSDIERWRQEPSSILYPTDQRSGPVTRPKCGNCGNDIQLHCHQDCSCHQLERQFCLHCLTGARNRKCGGEEAADESLVKQLFPPFQNSGVPGSRLFMNVSSILKREKKKLLFIHEENPDQFMVTLICDRRRTVENITVEGGEKVNEEVVRRFRSRMYEYDMNVLELKCVHGKEEKLDSSIESIVQLSASKSLICVLFCNRNSNGEQGVGRCYMKIKE